MLTVVSINIIIIHEISIKWIIDIGTVGSNKGDCGSINTIRNIMTGTDDNMPESFQVG